jgi:hypothetical protein
LQFRLLCCPAFSNRDPEGLPGVTTYLGAAGLGADAATLPADDPRAGVFGYDRRTPFSDIKDGVSTTILVIETTAPVGPWLAGGPATVRGLIPAYKPFLGSHRQFGGVCQSDLAQFAFVDGSVRALTSATGDRVLEALMTKAGGEKVRPDDF